MSRYKWVECGSCGHFHRIDFFGDCRQDDERFTTDQLEAMPGFDEGQVRWIEDQTEEEVW